ncbi:Fic family protein [Actinomycetes bacterium M1A6_2h]
MATEPSLIVQFEQRPWHSTVEYASRTQKREHAGPYSAAIPARIAEIELGLPNDVLAESEDAVREMVRFDEYVSSSLGSTVEPAPMSSILLRTESAASSQIENLTVGARGLALAELGLPTNRNASIVAGNVRAMEAAVAVNSSIDAESVLAMHHALMSPTGDPRAGEWRREQVWIGGSDVGPHRAVFVPPHHERLPGALEDMFEFASRTDLPVIPHVAVLHAQFETIHPFTDGNGRTGRALIHGMLRRSGVTQRSTVPLSAGLLTDTRSYFDSLTAYRAGVAEPIVRSFNTATFRAMANGRQLVDDLSAIRAEHANMIVARSDSVVWKVADALVAQPVIDNTYVQRAFGVSDMAAQRAIDRLVEAHVLTQTSKGRRNRVWQASDILAALDNLAERVRRASS